MEYTQYGIAHPGLRGVIPLPRPHAQAIQDTWPGATLMSRSSRPRRGITGVHPSWTTWEPVATTPAAPLPTAAAGRCGRARTPEDLPLLLAEYYNRQDLDGLLSLYETGAVLAIEDHQHVRHGALRDILARSIALGLPLSIEHTHVLAANDVALLLTDWTITGVDRKGKVHAQSGRSTDVVRTDDEAHSWRYVVDNPAGATWPETHSKNGAAVTHSHEPAPTPQPTTAQPHG